MAVAKSHKTTLTLPDTYRVKCWGSQSIDVDLTRIQGDGFLIAFYYGLGRLLRDGNRANAQEGDEAKEATALAFATKRLAEVYSGVRTITRESNLDKVAVEMSALAVSTLHRRKVYPKVADVPSFDRTSVEAFRASLLEKVHLPAGKLKVALDAWEVKAREIVAAKSADLPELDF